MTYDLFLALCLFALSSSITPGPNNLMLLASGANFGFVRSVPHMLGISIGFMLMVFLVGVGVKQLFDAFPASYTVMKILSVLYLLWLAFKIARAAPAQASDTTGNPLTFLQAAAFQWVNPKAWSMALTATTLYTPVPTIAGFALTAAIFGLVNLPSVSIWTTMGQQMAQFLTNPKWLRVFNGTMAALLVASLYPVLFP